ncbi:hypothetical protein LZQ00_12380 [Sphingobacterium sp. SRCM116780]|uniref:zinc finger domain-containing protein n=1 Tax=Sphingobacterium sp. SRCM116780 TaxID=2907623 RepID=UPI001F254954|nr:hypothetical protein [Sphingobacterium sp. SRCM116780]UIR55076.1 hypothetical protein LZQ00_12380 [Sphingobacterium sp. SRCM116780]
MSFEDKTAAISEHLQCQGCGALLHYQPGTSYLKCAYCGTENQITESDAIDHVVKSVDYEEFTTAMQNVADARFTISAEVVHCRNCGANSTLNPHITADLCAFCASPLVIDHLEERIVKPHGLIPFFVEEKKAFPLFKQWAGALWFAPNDFKRVFSAQNNRLKGVYIPFWSYDAEADSSYQGQRGEYYYVTRTRKTSDGKSESYEEQRTRWYYASGQVHNSFKDVLISASTSLPNNFASKIGPWNTAYLKPYNDQYLSGFIAETFTIDHVAAAQTAKTIMANEIEHTVRRDIGGDTQQVDNIDSTYHAIKLKYILLPVWLSAYQYKDKSYQIMVNAFNGTVYGQRPYSFWKIAFVVLLGLIIIFLLTQMG